MKISTQNAERLINKFEEAVRADAFRGTAHPDDQDAIEAVYKNARKKLYAYFIECIVTTAFVPNKATIKAIEEAKKGGKSFATVDELMDDLNK